MYSAASSPLPSRGSDFPSFEVGAFRVHPSRNLVEKGRDAHRLQPRIMHVLVCLASRGGEVVSREELLDTVWRDAVVCEDSLTRAVSDLRRIFADDPSSAAVFETIRKVGYRVVPTIEILDATAVGGKGSLAVGWLRVGAAIIVATILVAAAGLVLQPDEAESHGPIAFLAGRPLTSTPTNEYQPSLAPDGTAVAYTWSGPARDNIDIWIREDGSDDPQRLTDDPAPETMPAWSPDGSRLAFVRGGEPPVIFTIDRDGESPERVITLAGNCFGLDWSPDGRRLAFSSPLEAGGPATIQVLDLQSGATTIPLPDRAEGLCDLRPVFSPDGNDLAFVRAGAFYQQDVFVTSLDGSPARRLTSLQKAIRGLDWCAGGSSVIFASAPNGVSQLRRVSVDGGVPNWLPTQSRSATSPSVAFETGGLVYVEVRYDSDIWRLRIDALASSDADPEAALEPVIDSTRNDFGARLSPDGDRIAFVSDRGGSREIWICDADGTAARQLSDFGGPRVMNPHWSPGGDRIGFTIARDRYCGIGILDAGGGGSRLVGGPDRHELLLGWCAGGLYFESCETGRSKLCRMDETGGAIEELTDRGYQLVGATDEGDVYYRRAEEPGIWRIGTDGAETLVVSGERSEAWTRATLAGEWIYFLESSQRGPLLGRFRLEGEAVEMLTGLPAGPDSRLCVSPDGAEVLFSRVTAHERDLVIVDDFR